MNLGILEKVIEKFHNKDILIWKDFEYRFEQRGRIFEILSIDHERHFERDDNCKLCDMCFRGFASLVSHFFYLRNRDKSIQ